MSKNDKLEDYGPFILGCRAKESFWVAEFSCCNERSFWLADCILEYSRTIYNWWKGLWLVSLKALIGWDFFKNPISSANEGSLTNQSPSLKHYQKVLEYSRQQLANHIPSSQSCETVANQTLSLALQFTIKGQKPLSPSVIHMKIRWAHKTKKSGIWF